MPPAVENIARGRLPLGLDSRSLRRRALQIAVVLVIVGVVAALAPGLGDVRQRIEGAQPGWLGVAIVLELLSCLSYVLMFRPIFCARMSLRTSYQLGMSELAVGSLVPASGAAGLAFGAWALRKGGMPVQDIARRTVAFFVLKSAVNFVAVAVVGIAMWLGVGPLVSPALTLLPAVLAIVAIAAISLIPFVHARRSWTSRTAVALGQGIDEAARLLARRDWRVIAGSVGYWAFDNAVLWACLHAFGEAPPLTLVLMGYLIGQLGGLLPIPGGLGGIDGGLLGALVVYGLPAAAAAAAILAYRLTLFWLPLILGGAAFASLLRACRMRSDSTCATRPRTPRSRYERRTSTDGQRRARTLARGDQPKTSATSSSCSDHAASRSSSCCSWRCPHCRSPPAARRTSSRP